MKGNNGTRFREISTNTIQEQYVAYGKHMYMREYLCPPTPTPPHPK